MLFVLSPVSLLATVHTAGGLWLRVLKARFTCFLWLMHTASASHSLHGTVVMCAYTRGDALLLGEERDGETP